MSRTPTVERAFARDDGGRKHWVLAGGPGLGLAEDGQPPVEPLDTPVAFSPERSPDGEWLAFTDGENEADVWVVRPDGTGLRQLTTVG